MLTYEYIEYGVWPLSVVSPCEAREEIRKNESSIPYPISHLLAVVDRMNAVRKMPNLVEFGQTKLAGCRVEVVAVLDRLVMTQIMSSPV
jgi:hypothetical protein